MAGKTIAVDASIWMHQFLNAMRDKQGNLLNGAHIQGFFRRILKLLYYNVRPLFVFDGAAPALKKRTIAKRQERKASQSQSAKNTASQLLKARMQLYALDGTANPLISPSTQTLADPYSLPEPSKSSNQPYQDARLVSYNEMAHFVDCHNSLLDYSQLNIDSSEFQRLPIETQHAMIIDLKNASRAPNQERVDYISEGSTAIEFSRRQIQQLVYRATLTDRAHSMAKSGKNGGSDDRGGRVAASRNKSFLLVENSNAGVTFQPTDIPRNKKFADISGMNGFASFDLSAKSDIQIYGDMVGDDVPIDEIMKRIKENDVIFGSCEKVLDLSMSNLERYALGESRSKPPESKDPIPTLSYSVESQPPIHSSDFSPGDELFPSTTNSAPVVDELDWDDPPARKAVSGTSHLTSSKDIHIDFNTRRDDVPLKRNLPITKEDIGPKRTKFGHVVDAIPAVKHIPAAPNNSTAHAIESSSEDEWETFTGEMKIDLDVHVVEKVENPAKFDTILELELPTVTEIVSDSDEEWEAVPLQNANDVGSEDQQKELLEIFESNQHEAELEAPESVPYATEVLSDVDEADIDIDQEGDALNEFINSIQANSKEYAKTLNRKIINLESEQRKLKSTSDVVTFQMVQDVQVLTN